VWGIHVTFQREYKEEGREHRWRVIENRVQGRIFGPKGEEVAGS